MSAQPKFKHWIKSSLERFYRLSPAESAKTLSVSAAKGERFSFQICLRLEGENEQTAAYKAGLKILSPGAFGVRIRTVGFVPVMRRTTGVPDSECEGVQYLPGLCPDPLLDSPEQMITVNETNGFWVTVQVPEDIKAGDSELSFELLLDEKSKGRVTVKVSVADVVIRKRKDFSVTHWFYADNLLDWYKLKPWEDKFWDSILPAYLSNLTSHFQDMVYVPVLTPPLDGVKRPSQLLTVTRKGKDKYAFDWKYVEKWIKAAKKAGLEKFEWTHLFTQWGVKNAIRVYEGDCDARKLLWEPETGATSDTYRKFLGQLLPELKNFIGKNRLADKSFFHISDEPRDEHLANYKAAKDMVLEIAPWMKFMDAVSHVEFAEQKLTDMPVPSISAVEQFIKKGIPSWAYFCCGPRGKFVNRFMDTPLEKIRLTGWLLYKSGVLGFLHWGYNYWCKSQTAELIDPYKVNDAHLWPGWAAGDPFVVYPGENGPVDSIRWEVFAEGLQDFALLQTLGVERGSKELSPLKGFDSFPASPGKWLTAARKKALN
jgi:hypothetical protein